LQGCPRLEDWTVFNDHFVVFLLLRYCYMGLRLRSSIVGHMGCDRQLVCGGDRVLAPQPAQCDLKSLVLRSFCGAELPASRRPFQFLREACLFRSCIPRYPNEALPKRTLKLTSRYIDRQNHPRLLCARDVWAGPRQICRSASPRPVDKYAGRRNHRRWATYLLGLSAYSRAVP